MCENAQANLTSIPSFFLLCPRNPTSDHLINPLHPLPTRLHLKPLSMLLPTRLALLHNPLFPELQMNQPLHPMRMRHLPDLARTLPRHSAMIRRPPRIRRRCMRRRRRRRRRRNIRIVPDQRQRIPTLASPLIHTTMDIIRAPNLQQNRVLASSCGSVALAVSPAHAAATRLAFYRVLAQHV